MRHKQPKYYLLYGIRTHSQLLKPRMAPMGKFNLPLEAIYQYMRDNGAIVGPSPQDRIFNTEGARVFIEHVKTLDSTLGNPRRTVINANTLEVDFRRANRMFRPLRKDDALRIANKNMLVVNYNMLNPLYRYIASYKATYQRWYNNSVTFWNHVNDIHERFKWNQYIEFEIPLSIPKRGRWEQATNGITQTNLENFPTQAHLTALDFYKWLGNDRETSVMSRLSKEAYPNINLLFRLHTHFFVLNLGAIDSWRKDPSLKSSSGQPGDQLQIKFVRLLDGLADFMREPTDLSEDNEGLFLDLEPKPEKPSKISIKETVVTDGTVTEVQEEEEDEDASELVGTTPSPLGDGTDLFDGMDLDVFEPPPGPATGLSTINILDGIGEDDTDDEDPIGQTMSDITEDDDDQPVSFADQLLADPNVAPIAVKAYELAETGIITHRSMNRAIEDALSYTTMPDPYNSGKTVAEAMKLEEGDLELPPQKDFTDKPTIIDKSMLSSKLKEATGAYVKNVLRKDVLQAVVAVQKMGVAVKDYKVEVVRDVMNHYEIHSVTIKPVRGRQTTIRFRIPVVDKDGRFISNGVVYRMKWQRAD